MKQCKRCGEIWPDVFFRISREKIRGANHRKHHLCIGCELTGRTEAKQANRFYEKAKKAYYHHAKRFIEQGVIKFRPELADKFGWILKQMAHDIEHASKNGCPYCRQPFSEMAHGLADVSLDIIDPRLPPFYRTNVRWVCKTCNSEKQRTPPELWGEKLQCWEHWRKRQEALQSDQWIGTLFEGIDTGQMRLI